MKIEKLILNNFRGYDHAEIALNGFNCIVGKNDVGKSTIFEALKWFFNKDYTYWESNFNYKSFKYDKETYSFYDEETDSFENSEEETNYLVDGDLMYVELCFSGFKGLEYAWDYYAEGGCPYFIDDADFLDEKGLFCIKKILINTSSSQFVHYYQDETTPVYYLKCKCYGEDKEPISLIGNVFDYYSNIVDRDDLLLKKHKELSNRRSCSNLVEIPECEKLISKKIREYYSKCECVYREVDIAKYGFYITDLFPKFYLFTPETFGVEANKIINYYFGNKIGNSLKIESLNGLIQDDLDAIANALNRFGLVGDVELVPSIYINWSEMVNVSFNFRDGKHKLPLSNRGDGVKRILLNTVFRMIAYKGYGHNLIFAFDEPETGLHPSAQTDFLESLKHLSSIYHQVFITTHSPTIVSQCKPDEIIHIKKDENGISKACQNDDTSLKEVVEDLGIMPNSELLSVLGFADFFLFVEGKHDVFMFNHLLKLHNLSDVKIALIPMGSGDNVKLWSDLDLVKNLNRPYMFLVDSDNKAKDNRQGEVVALRKREFENYLKYSSLERLFNVSLEKYCSVWDKVDVPLVCWTEINSILMSSINYERVDVVVEANKDKAFLERLGNSTNGKVKSVSNESLKKRTENIKDRINKYFFEEENASLEDLDFHYIDDSGIVHDEFMEIYSKIKTLRNV